MRYRRGCFLPDYLIRGMLDFGVNFLNFKAIPPETLDVLRGAVKDSWAVGEGSEEQSGENEDGDFEDTLTSGALPRAALESIGHRPSTSQAADDTAEEQEQEASALERLVSNSVLSSIGGTSGAEDGDQGRSAQDREPVVARKRKRKGATSSSSGRAKTPKTPAVVPTGKFLRPI